MANKTTFVVQSFVLKRGRLVPGTKDIAPTQNGAVKRTEAVSTRFPSSAAISVVADDETGEVAAVSITETLGRCPTISPIA